MIQTRRAQRTFGDGLIAEEVKDLHEGWMKHADQRCYGASGEDKASSSLETTDGVPHAAAE